MARRFFVLIALISCLRLSTAVSAQSSNCDSSIDNGVRALNAVDTKDYSAAVDYYTCAIASFPLDPELNVGKAESAILAGRYADAWGPYTVLIYYFPDVLQQRVDTLKGIVARNPRDAKSQLLLAQAYQGQGDYENAESAVDAALKLEPDDAFANAMKAELRGQSGDKDGFLTYAKKAENSTSNPHVLATLASDYDQYASDPDTGIGLIKQALETDPNDANFHSVYGYLLYYGKNDKQGGADEYRQAMLLNPTNMNNLIAASSILMEAGERDLATQALDQLEKLVPTGAREYLVTRAFADSAGGDLVAAAEDIGAYAGANPSKIVEGGTLRRNFESTEAMVYDRLIHYTVSLKAGETVTVRAVGVDGKVDTMLAVIAPSGQGVAFSDDYDVSKNYDAQATFTADTTGDYTLWVTHAGSGSYGDVTTSISVARSGLPASTPVPEATELPIATVTPEATFAVEPTNLPAVTVTPEATLSLAAPIGSDITEVPAPASTPDV